MPAPPGNPSAPSWPTEIPIVVRRPDDPSYAVLGELIAVTTPEVRLLIDIDGRADLMPSEIGTLLCLHRQAAARGIAFRIAVSDERLRGRLRQLGRDIGLVVVETNAEAAGPGRVSA
jgi:hypothetical protein